jgi:RHS repeat-associated protein
MSRAPFIFLALLAAWLTGQASASRLFPQAAAPLDALNQVTNVTDWTGRKTAIQRDLAGQIISIIRPNGTRLTNGFDLAGQLTSSLDQMANTLPIGWFKFNWTNSGNMAWEFAAPLPHSVAIPTRTMTYDDDNHLATVNGTNVTSDANGNLTGVPGSVGALGGSYDARNRLTTLAYSTNLDAYVYAPTGGRRAVVNAVNGSVVRWVNNPNAALPQALLRIKNGVTNYYVYGVGLLYQITETATATNALYYHYDYRGSTVALTADNGQVTDRVEYSLYGLTTYRTGTTDTPFLFNGKYGVQTDGSGLLYMNARYYNPYICRFMSADPSGFGGGLNQYAYADGNPVSLIDPFGLGAISDTAFSSWLQSDSQRQFAPNNDFGNGLLGLAELELHTPTIARAVPLK